MEEGRKGKKLMFTLKGETQDRYTGRGEEVDTHVGEQVSQRVSGRL